ncbi:hypothetical protein ACET3Z_017070 [Daucus carota]
MSSLSSSELAIELRKVGNKLLALASCVTTQVEELLQILDELEGLLSKVEQAPSRSMQDALYPSMKALISNQLLKHTDTDVKVSLASCMSELIRITAPDAPYDDAEMKDIFQLTVMAFGMLSNKDTRGYSKALHILDNIVKVKACLLMLDLECDGLIADMFKQFLSSIRYISLSVVFQQMEYIMTLTLEESEEIPEEFLSSLLSSVNNKKENALSRSWRLGESVLRNCAGKLQHFLPKLVRSRNLSFDDYSIVVASICENSPKDKHVAALETDPSATKPSESLIDVGTGQKVTNGTLWGGNSLRTLEHSLLAKQQGNNKAQLPSQAEKSDVTGIVQVKAATTPKKRGRKPKSLQKPEEGSGIPHGISVFGEKLVGRRIKVWWPLDKFFYEGAVASFDSVTQTHKVLYADGDEETLNLNNERWDLLEEPTMEYSSPAAASHKSMKKKAKRKSASTEKQGTPSSSKWPGFADKSKTEAPKCSSADNDFVLDAATADSNAHAPIEDDKQKSSSQTDASKPDVLSIADGANGSNTVNPNKTDAKHKFDSEEEAKTLTIIREPEPCSIVECGGESATHTKITENDKLPHEKLSEVGEIGMLPDSVDVECGGQSATHTKITEDDKLPREKPSEDGETGMLPDPVDELMHPEAI